METQASAEDKAPRETGAKLHRRETNWQIYLPFLLGILGLVGLFLIVGLPSDPVWRDRAQAIGDFMYTFLCMIPMLLCIFPIYVVMLVLIYGMRKVHDGTERPLRKLEKAAASLAERIENVTQYINEKTQSFAESYQPIDENLDIFDSPHEEVTSDEPK